MFEYIKSVLNSEGILRVGMIDIADCDIINERILPNGINSAVIFIIPYRSQTEIANDGFSEYARVYDYHTFCKHLYERILDKLSENSGYKFYGFCDHSPVNEKLAAAKCGLGVIGRNSLFIDETYGSYVFIGSILTDAKNAQTTHEISFCEDCGKCIAACPNSAIIEKGIDRFKCLSGISQKKSKTTEEKELLKAHNIVWGCDICQNVCPHNKSAKISPIPYFKETRIPKIDKEFVLSLSDDDFKKYAFAYKGRKLVLDNIDFI